MTTRTSSSVHRNEVVVVDGALDPRGRPYVTLGLVNVDGSDTFPGRTLSPDQADELAASLVLAAAAARATAGLAPAPHTKPSLGDTATAIRGAVALSEPDSVAGAAHQQSDREPASSTDEQEGLQTFPIADYDTLKASKIMKRLPGLTAAQLSAVLAYERLHRNRKKVRARIIELLADAQT